MSDLRPSDYRAEFNQAVRDQLAAMERAIDAFNGFAEHMDGKLDTLDTRLRELQENDVELKKLVMEQGADLRALRARLENGNGEA